MSDPYKVALVGESGVGKTCIIKKFTEGKFDQITKSSDGAQFNRKTIATKVTINFLSHEIF